MGVDRNVLDRAVDLLNGGGEWARLSVGPCRTGYSTSVGSVPNSETYL